MARGRILGASALALALVAAACGGDDSDAASTTSSGATETTEGGATTSAGPTTTRKPVATPESMEEWEALWDDERAAVVAEIEENGWGLQADGTTVTGPDGFEMDLSVCPQGWSDTEGLSDTEIKIGHPTALSGTLADSSNIAKGMDTVFGYYNAEGVYTDSEGKSRKVTLITKDDGYDPARTIPLVDELIDSEKVFDVWTLGSPGTMKVYDKLNQRCIPHLFAITGHPAWGDPVNHPWTTGILLAYNTEAVLWGSFIDQRIDELTADDGKVVVAALAMNNDFGKAYDESFKAYVAQSPNKDKIDYVVEFIEPQAATVKDPMTTLASKNPEVFIEMVAGTPCAQIITEAAENGMNEDTEYKFAASVCKASTFVGQAAVGDASNGWWIMGGGFRDMNSPAEDGNPFIEWGRELLAENGIDHMSSGNLGTGVSMGWNMTQVLRIAGELEGGLTRSNLITAARATDMTNPAYLEGIRWNLRGGSDGYWVEGSEVAIYDSAKQQWVPQGDIVELSGKSTPCAWNQATSICE